MAQMTKEKKSVAKMANRKKAGTEKKFHGCGGELIWSMVFNPRGRMMQVCQKCGTAVGKGN